MSDTKPGVRNERSQERYRFIRDAVEVSLSDLASAFGMSHGAAHAWLAYQVRAGIIIKVRRGVYAAAEEPRRVAGRRNLPITLHEPPPPNLPYTECSCVRCGETFWRTSGQVARVLRLGRSLYCSGACRRLWLGEQRSPDLACACCGKSFRRRPASVAGRSGPGGTVACSFRCAGVLRRVHSDLAHIDPLEYRELYGKRYERDKRSVPPSRGRLRYYKKEFGPDYAECAESLHQLDTAIKAAFGGMNDKDRK